MKFLFAFILGLFSFSFALAQDAKLKEFVIVDFNGGERSSNLGEDFGTWDRDPSDMTQGCKMSFRKEDALGAAEGKSLRLEYDVDSPNPAYNGFWLKIAKAEASKTQALSFYIKGDAEKGFTTRIKLELKDKKKGKATFFIENITDRWQKITLDLDPRSFEESKNKPFEEFVIVFDDVNSRPKKGAILIDHIEIG